MIWITKVQDKSLWTPGGKPPEGNLHTDPNICRLRLDDYAQEIANLSMAQGGAWACSCEEVTSVDTYLKPGFVTRFVWFCLLLLLLGLPPPSCSCSRTALPNPAKASPLSVAPAPRKPRLRTSPRLLLGAWLLIHLHTYTGCGGLRA